MAITTGCDVCNKASLSLLLLRPSPIAKDPLLAPAGVTSIAASDSAVSDLVPNITESRFALRLLRAGYVHLYIGNPPPGVKSWLIYRVTAKGDLIPENHALFAQTGEMDPCIRPGHIATGTKVISIPQAHRVTEIWIAFSANIWTDAIRERNKANPKAMQKISLRGASPNTFKPTASALRAQVLECKLQRLVIDGSGEQDFEFTSLAGEVEELAANLTRAAAKHPRTIGKELAVVVRDPVGISAELNSLRIRRNEIIKKEFAKDENRHPLQSSDTILGLKKAMLGDADVRSYEEVTPLITEMEYSRRTGWPKGTKALPVTAEYRALLLKDGGPEVTPLRRQQLLDGLPMVRVIYPNIDERSLAWMKKKSEENWPKFERYYDEKARALWIKKFNEKMQRDHYGPLQRLELDWLSTLEAGATVEYFNRHFDANGPVGKKSQAVECAIFMHESALIHQPAPLTAGIATDRYLGLMEKPINDKDAILLRSLVANIGSLFDTFHVQLTGDPGDAGMRDKSFDLLKGFSELGFSQSAMQSHGWIGHALAFYSVGQLSAISSAVFSVAAKSAANSPRMITVMKKLLTLSIVHRTLEFAVEGAVKGAAPKLPVLITMNVSADEALAIMTERRGQNFGVKRSQVLQYQASQTLIPLTLLTDTDAIKAANGDVTGLVHDAAHGRVKLGTAGTAAAAKAAGRKAVLSKDAFLQLYRGQATLAAKSANLLRNALPAIAATESGSVLLGMAKTLDARLAVASCVIQIIGIWYGAKALYNANNSSAALDATYGLLDSVAGFSGGALQLVASYKEMRLLAAQQASSRVSANVAAASIRLGVLRVAASVTGVAGGGINYLSSIKKSGDQEIIGNEFVSTLYTYSAFASLGTAVSSATLAAGIVVNTLEARAVGGAVVSVVASRIGIAGALVTVGGLAITVSGIGLVLLGAGIAFQVGAILLTPTDIQRWLGRSYFGTDGGYFVVGKRSDMFVKGDWKAEQDALHAIISDAPLKAQE